ncbi:MAG: exopolyphosphatase [Lachnospiraceae bacterium]|jgi:exopolyphosphatase/guanosine-5'-triphosphate,3'-diphosphate pyrophosphatase
MAITTFAAIDISSYDVNMRVFEISRKYGMKQIEDVRSRLEVGKDIYVTGKIPNHSVHELCRILNDFKRIMEEYRVDDFRACATTSLREAENVWLVVEQVYQQTGISIEILSNSERRFLGYKSIAYREQEFTRIIQKGTAIIEVGGGSVQVSLFDKDSLVTTQSFRLGNLRIRERLLSMEKETVYYERLVRDLINHEILSFKKLHLKDREIKNVILMGNNFVDAILGKKNAGRESFVTDCAEFDKVYKKIINQSPEQIAVAFGIPLEYSSLLIPTLIIYHSFMEVLGAESMWLLGAQLNDGMAYDYGEKHKLIRTSHNFENDIVMAAKNIGKRYGISKSHVQAIMESALAIFDSMKKIHGMGPRERLLLQIAVLLHDCGRYISLGNVGECSYNIIMATEIIGLSHKERQIIANVAKFHTTSYEYYGNQTHTELGRSDYMLVGKLTAILRVAGVLDCAHQRKIKSIQAVVRDGYLVMSVESGADLVLEEGLLAEQADFFEEVYCIRPKLRRKRSK